MDVRRNFRCAKAEKNSEKKPKRSQTLSFISSSFHIFYVPFAQLLRLSLAGSWYSISTTTTVRLKTEQNQLVSVASRFNLGLTGLQGA
jgi:hypothetical protein